MRGGEPPTRKRLVAVSWIPSAFILNNHTDPRATDAKNLSLPTHSLLELSIALVTTEGWGVSRGLAVTGATCLLFISVSTLKLAPQPRNRISGVEQPSISFGQFFHEK